MPLVVLLVGCPGREPVPLPPVVNLYPCPCCRWGGRVARQGSPTPLSSPLCALCSRCRAVNDYCPVCGLDWLRTGHFCIHRVCLKCANFAHIEAVRTPGSASLVPWGTELFKCALGRTCSIPAMPRTYRPGTINSFQGGAQAPPCHSYLSNSSALSSSPSSTTHNAMLVRA